MPRRDDKRSPLGSAPRGGPVAGTKPEWKRAEPVMPCPDCGADLAEVRMKVEHPQLRGGKGSAFFLGCPACGFVTPAVYTADS